MTIPTKAQITLAANAIAYELNLGHSDIRPHIERAAERALTVAAQVGPSEYKRGFEDCQKGRTDEYAELFASHKCGG